MSDVSKLHFHFNETMEQKEKPQITRDYLRKLEAEIYNVLQKNDIYPEDGTWFSADRDDDYDVELYLVIDGDWKHDHLFAEHLVEQFCKEKGFTIVSSENNEIGNSESDWYKSAHHWYIKIK